MRGVSVIKGDKFIEDLQSQQIAIKKLRKLLDTHRKRASTYLFLGIWPASRDFWKAEEATSPHGADQHRQPTWTRENLSMVHAIVK
jgi:hypothetical protein